MSEGKPRLPEGACTRGAAAATSATSTASAAGKSSNNSQQGTTTASTSGSSSPSSTSSSTSSSSANTSGCGCVINNATTLSNTVTSCNGNQPTPTINQIGHQQQQQQNQNHQHHQHCQHQQQQRQQNDPNLTLSITPTTGGQFDLIVDKRESVDSLKKIISKRLKVAKERICLLHRER